MHYQRWRKHGDPTFTKRPGMAQKMAATPENFWARTKPDGACVVWTGYTDPQGYGRINIEGIPILTHRYAFYLRMGRWPDGILRHLCDNPPCVLHAVEGTYSENAFDKVAAGNHHSAKKTHCPQGHPYDEANTYVWRRERRCRACIKQHAREYYLRKKSA